MTTTIVLSPTPTEIAVTVTEKPIPVSLVGMRGLTGPQGIQGEQGIQGATGATGATGPAPAHQWSTTELQFQNPDDSWGTLVDLKGATGDTGPQGIQGVKGDTGDTGAKGEQGIQGEQGETGPTGPAGADGADGTDGSNAPEVQIEYSSDNATFHSPFESGDEYVRFSTDNGVTWTTGYKFIGDDGSNAPEIQIEYSADDTTYHSTFVDGDKYIRFSVDDGTTWTDGKLFIGLRTMWINVIFDGADVAIETGIKSDIVMPACTIEEVYMFSGQTGSIVIDLWKDTYANFPPTDADSITASAPPTISTATKSSDSTLTGWTTTVNAGDIIRVNVDSCTDIQTCTLAIKITA